MENLQESLRMTALAVLFQTKWNSKKANRPNDFVIKEALVTVASLLQDDDIGYFYNPRTPKEICTNPGELVGKISNSHLPYDFDFRKGTKNLVDVLNSLNDDYNCFGIVVSDCMKKEDCEQMFEDLKELQKGKIYIFGIGKCCIVEGITHVEDAADLENALSRLDCF